MREHISNQAGDALAWRLYPKNAQLRFAFEEVAAHFLAIEMSIGLSLVMPTVGGPQPLFYTVCAIASEDRQHSPEALARCIVHFMTKRWPEIPARRRAAPALHFTPVRRRRIIRHQLRWRGRMNPAQLQTLGHYDRVLCAIISQVELHRALLQLLGCGKARNVQSTRLSLEHLIRHTAKQARPSIETSIEDIRILRAAELREVRRKTAREKLPAAEEKAEIEKRLKAFRTKRNLKPPAAVKDVENGGTFDVLDRRARQKLRARDLSG